MRQLVLLPGGAVGSFVPVVGTVAGAVVGGVVGLFEGMYAYTTKCKTKTS